MSMTIEGECMGEEKGDLNRINCGEHCDLQSCEATKDLSVKSVLRKCH